MHSPLKLVWKIQTSKVCIWLIKSSPGTQFKFTERSYIIKWRHNHSTPVVASRLLPRSHWRLPISPISKSTSEHNDVFSLNSFLFVCPCTLCSFMALIFSGVISLDAGQFRTVPQTKNVLSVFRAAHESSTGRYWAILFVRFYDTVLFWTIWMENSIVLFVSLSSFSHHFYRFHIIMMRLNLRTRVKSQRYRDKKRNLLQPLSFFCVQYWNGAISHVHRGWCKLLGRV